MLLDSFFKITKIEENWNAVRFNVSINFEHKIFEGHFPQQPVVPGVFSLQMIKECLEWFHNKKYQYSELINCKFLNPIFPEQDRELLIECEYELADSFLLKAKILFENTVYLTLKAKLNEI